MSGLIQIGQYRIEEKLGAGEWTETYHAYDVVLRRPAALKLLRPGKLPSERKYKEFLEQAQLAAELVHPRIAWVWSTGETEGRYYLTERYVGGDALGNHLEQAGPLPWDQSMKIIEQIAQAIEFAEERGWTHGRTTPHNILLSADHGAVLSDYGLANAIRRSLPDAALNLYDAAYLPPEALEGQPLSARSDQYALACTLVEIVAGKNPFAAPSLEEIWLMKTTQMALPLVPLESVPPQAGEVIERALHPEPSARFDNALDFVTALGRAVRAGMSDAALRRQHEERLQRWREAEEQKRLEVEEAARRTALEQARREIQERAHREAELSVGEAILDDLAEVDDSSSPKSQNESQLEPTTSGVTETERSAHRRSAATRRKAAPQDRKRRLWPFYTLALLVALGLGGYWLNGRQPFLTPPTASPTPSQAIQQAAPSEVIAPSETVTSSPSITPTPTNTPRPTSTLTRTPTRTPAPSNTPTVTPTETLQPTATRNTSPPEDRGRD